MDFTRLLKERYHIPLYEQQAQAVLTKDGPVLLLAVPGGGKTTVIICRCANLILNHGIDPAHILTLTFSRMAALDMKRRFGLVFGEDAGKHAHFSTIHSFCYGVVQSYHAEMQKELPAIIEGSGAPTTKLQLLRQIYYTHNKTHIAEDTLDELSNFICYIKNMMIPEEHLRFFKTTIGNFLPLYREYEQHKLRENLMDFDDMLTMTMELFEKNKGLIARYRARYRYINIDESQDTSYLQHEIIRCLAAPRNNIFMVGDEDQTIYSFRAAFPGALLQFEATYPGAQIYKMERNFRSTGTIVRAADSFIRQNEERYDKHMFCKKAEGEPIQFTCLRGKNEQYDYLSSALQKETDYSGMAILYRNNMSAIPLVDMLDRASIPFYLREVKAHLFRHWITADIIHFFNLSADGADLKAFRQIYYKLNAYLSRAMYEYVAQYKKPNQNVFDRLIQFPDMDPRTKKKIPGIKEDMGEIAEMEPLKAIEFIEDTYDYRKYLENRSSEDTYEGLLQVLDMLKTLAQYEKTIPAFMQRLQDLPEIMGHAGANKGKNAVTLSTVHSCKGLEFKKVFILDLIDGQFPSAASIGELKEGKRSMMEEEVRLFYVGITRAMEKLELIIPRTIDGKKVKESRFVKRLRSICQAEGNEPAPAAAERRGKKRPGRY